MDNPHFKQDPAANLSFSEDDGDGSSTKNSAVKRGTRACDRCRKIKSKCEPGVGEKCKNCEAADTQCTFQGPSFKRGPPKGYIHSIEQRWHQVECILATIMESPRAQELIDGLRSDPFADFILNRVEAGPYGSSSRFRQPRQPNSENFYASLVDTPERAPLKEDRRSRRQSRISREIVSMEDSNASRIPTKQWQEQLIRRLESGGMYQPASSGSPSSPASSSGDPSRATRQPDALHPNRASGVNAWEQYGHLYTFSDNEDVAEAFGHLSMDENKEIRYHGPASGLPLLAQSDRKPGDNAQANGVWKFNKSHLYPDATNTKSTNEEDDVYVDMPPPEMQRHLLQVYFACVHPFFPVVHKSDFISHYNTSQGRYQPIAPHSTTLDREPMQRPCKMLLLAMFAIAARYSDRLEDLPDRNGNAWEAGNHYANDAHRLLDRKYQSSRPSTCQALLLLSMREFAMGGMEKGWLYSGMAMRMAVDLGMNRNADQWTLDGRQALFSPVEKQIRKHIWWGCCMCDKLSAVWLGRPITFRANDYSTTKPDVDEPDEHEMWQPYPAVPGRDHRPQPGRIMSVFRHACGISIIITDIMDKIYPVQIASEDKPRRILFDELESRLNKWFVGLPDYLHYEPANKAGTPLPHVLLLHIEYCAAVLLLHRAFIPAQTEGTPTKHALNGSGGTDPLATKAFNICQAAAAHITTMTTAYNDKYGLEKAPPFLSIYLQSAGIMHVITLTRRPWDTQATVGLTQCITACRRMERLWPVATRLRMLLEGAKVHLDQTALHLQNGVHNDRKRSAEMAMGSARHPEETSHKFAHSTPPQIPTSSAWDYHNNAQAVAQTLGLDAPGVDASPYYSSHQWWPRHLVTTEGLTSAALSAPMEFSGLNIIDPTFGTMAGVSPGIPAHDHFTFDQQQLSQDFIDGVDGVNYPLLNFSRFNDTVLPPHSHA